jgi:uncharacterized short protein YbdD (DUF466 family)
VLLRNILKPAFACTETDAGSRVDACVACARSAAAQIRHGWLRMLGAPDYRAYLVHHAANHTNTVPLSEREFVAVYIERRYGARDAGRCC